VWIFNLKKKKKKIKVKIERFEFHFSKMTSTPTTKCRDSRTESPQILVIRSILPNNEEIKESCDAIKLSKALTMLLSNEHCEIIEQANLEEKLAGLVENANRWEQRIEAEYTEEQTVLIDSLHNFLLNKSNGFSHLNNLALYEEIIASDKSGNLLKEASEGMKLSKKLILAGDLFPGKTDQKFVNWPRILDCDIDSDDMECLLYVDSESLSKALCRKTENKRGEEIKLRF
jgi:hypothetical protein